MCCLLFAVARSESCVVRTHLDILMVLHLLHSADSADSAVEDCRIL